MKLPNAERAVVDMAKLRDYCLNPAHLRGRHKARIFLSQLGLSKDQSGLLLKAILEAVLKEEAKPAVLDEFGQRYTVDFQMVGPVKRVMVRTTWIVKENEDFPRLTSCYIL